MKKIIKMNTGKKYLSLGNLFYYIKKYCNNKDDVLQSDIFCSIFDIDYINNTTVNNYVTGIRAIGMDYKKIIIDLKKKYDIDKKVFIKNLVALISLLDDYIYVVNNESLNNINNNLLLKKVCNEMIILSNEDINVNNSFNTYLASLYNKNNLYDCFINLLFYTVLENRQPIFNNNIKINIDESLKDFLKIKLYEGVSYITQVGELAKLGNVYANIEMGSLEFNGYVSGRVNYKKSYDYYYIATKSSNPKAHYMVAYLILNKNIPGDIKYAWENLKIAINLGSIAALNTMGLCFLSGNNPDKLINEKEALNLFKKSSSYGYSFAYNNLGKYYEKKDINKAFSYYKCSADLNNSWALNKVGEYYRKINDMDNAYYYYYKSSMCPINEACYYSFYNLAKYYYLIGNKELNIKKDIKRAKDFFEIAAENGIFEANIELKKLELS